LCLRNNPNLILTSEQKEWIEILKELEILKEKDRDVFMGGVFIDVDDDDLSGR